MTVREFMHNPIQFVPATCELREAVQILSQNKIGLLVVVEPGSKKMVGVFSERDLVNRVVSLGKEIDNLFVNEVMTSNVLTVPASATPFQALNIMLYQHVRHLPVVDDTGQLLGMLSIRDLLQNMLEHGFLI